MTTTEPEITVAPATGGGYGYPLTDTREVPLNLAGAPDLSTGMRAYAPQFAKIVYFRRFLGDAQGWSSWRVTVHVSGPRRLTSGNLSDRSRVSAAYREDAAPDSVLALPEYLRPAVEAWRPTTDVLDLTEGSAS